jgi:N-formylglutamate deformylase
MSDEVFDFHAGDTPLLISIPHGGTELPAGLAARFTDEASALPDTDWHVPRLYDFARDMGASVLAARYSRYVIDLNRPETDETLYPGQATTGLVPTTLFDGAPVYRDGQEPDAAEIEERKTRFWRPYHDRLREELGRMRARHGIALLWDAHSIRSRVPRLFDGVLPDFNIGTVRGASCHASIANAVLDAAKAAAPYRAVLDGRFVGGHITRTHGRPGEGVHAVQLELSQATYMDEAPPFAFREALAAKVRPCLAGMMQAALTTIRRLAG